MTLVIANLTTLHSSLWMHILSQVRDLWKDFSGELVWRSSVTGSEKALEGLIQEVSRVDWGRLFTEGDTVYACQIVYRISMATIKGTCNSISVHQGFAYDPLRIGWILVCGQPWWSYVSQRNFTLIVWLPRNGLLNVLLYCYFYCTCDHSKHHNLGMFHCFEKQIAPL